MSNREKKLVIVTGANRGLGLEVCRQLAQQGYRVVLTARDEALAQQAAAKLSSTGDVQAAQLDVTRQVSVDAFTEWARTGLGPIHSLVNNAGVSMNGFDAEVVKGTLDVNFFGVLRVTSALAPFVNAGGNVVMVSSGMADLGAYSPAIRARFLDETLTVEALRALVGEFESDVSQGVHEARGWPTSAYRVSKAALNGLTRVLARHHPQLRVNSVCPGWVKTDMGGRGANRTVEQGARGIVWAATLGADSPSGGFFRDGKAIEW